MAEPGQPQAGQRVVNVHEAKTHFSRLIDAADLAATRLACRHLTGFTLISVDLALQVFPYRVCWWSHQDCSPPAFNPPGRDQDRSGFSRCRLGGASALALVWRCFLAMTLAALHTPVDASAPLRLPEDLQLSLEQFAVVCQANPEAVLELDASGRLIHMTPTGSETGARNSSLLILMGLAVRSAGLALKLFDSSTGFLLPDGSVLSPDASLVRQERWQALTQEQRRGFAPLCPDLVVELASPSDQGPRGLTALRRKMAAYQANGAQLGWLLIPEEQAVEVWPASGAGDPQRLDAATVLDAGLLFPGLRIDLEEIWTV